MRSVLGRRMVQTIYKVMTEAEWAQAQERGRYEGSSDDARDGFIHMSTAVQLRGTLDKHFAGERDLALIAFEAQNLGEALRWEPSRGGALFPHVYGEIDPGHAQRVWSLDLDDDGLHVLPEGVG